MLKVSQIDPDSGDDQMVPIHTWNYKSSFGNPSGHAMSSMTLSLALVIDYMQAKIESVTDTASNRLSVGTGEERINLEREALSKFPII